MPKSRNISDYFEAKLSDLRPGEYLPIALHLYFPQNSHVVTWKAAGDLLTDGFVDKYRSRGLERFWVLLSDKKAFERYLRGETAQNAAEPAYAPDQPPAPQQFRSAAGKSIADILNAPELNEKQRTAMTAKTARAVLAQAALAPPDPPAQKEAAKEARNIVQDILEHALEESHHVAKEIWALANIDPELEHAVNVSTFAVIFAMAFGKIDKELISDIAMAGLLHDVGLSQVSAELVPIPWKSLKTHELRGMANHVTGTLELLELLAPEIPERVRGIIFQHHEKFDGTGYPQRLQGFKMDDVAQLLAIADLLDALSTGQWDGTERTLMETFTALEKIEKARTFPEHFNPEVFAAVLRWIRNYKSPESAREAISIVGNQVRALVNNAKI